MPNTPPRTTSVLPHHSPPSQPASPASKRTAIGISRSTTANIAQIMSSSSSLPQTSVGGTEAPSTGARTLPDDAGTPHLHNTAATLNAAQVASVHAKADPLQVKLLSDTARAPTRGSALAAGYDLYCSKDTTIPARGRTIVPTDISIAIPEGTYGRVAPRSGLAVKHGLQTGAGVIDADYRGAVGVVLFNHGDADFEMRAGDRCAQLVLERIVNPDVVVVETLAETGRGAGGFGSTGGFGAKS